MLHYTMERCHRTVNPDSRLPTAAGIRDRWLVIRMVYRILTLVFVPGLFLGSCDSTSSSVSEVPPNADCENGFVGEYPCNNVDLYAVLTPEELLGERVGGVDVKLNDIWGWIDPETGQEYALAGLTDGVSFVDVTDPSEPVVIGKLPEFPSGQQKYRYNNRPEFLHDESDGFKEASDWRDIKVYENTMYVVSEQHQYGMQVFDLTRLRDAEDLPVFFDEDSRYTLFGNAHNLAINEETGFAYIVGIMEGSECAEKSSLHMIDLGDPLQPQFAGCYYEEEAGGRVRAGYVHDTQCVIYRGPDARYQGQEICFSSAERVFVITDVTKKENAETIAISGYEGNRYSHQGWLTEDHRYFFMNDELDEIQLEHNTRTYIWDVGDLENPEMIGYYEHSTRSTDHNLYIVDDIMYQANYRAGLRVLDVSNPLPEAVHEIGFFNTTPNSNDPGFEGLWSVYPWLSGDKIIASDINNGLFVLRFER